MTLPETELVAGIAGWLATESALAGGVAAFDAPTPATFPYAVVYPIGQSPFASMLARGGLADIDIQVTVAGRTDQQTRLATDRISTLLTTRWDEIGDVSALDGDTVRIIRVTRPDAAPVDVSTDPDIAAVAVAFTAMVTLI